jgi:hypothetical protein
LKKTTGQGAEARPGFDFERSSTSKVFAMFDRFLAPVPKAIGPHFGLSKTRA